MELIIPRAAAALRAAYTASVRQLHAKAPVIVAAAAAAKLQEQDYYRWIFANESEREESQ